MRLFRSRDPHSIVEVSVASIVGNPYQPRRDVDEKHLQQLTQSIAAYGVIVPIIVRPRPNGREYELVAGQRRLLACRRLGWKKVPAVIRHYDDQQVMEVGLLENLQRRNLSSVEEAEALMRLSTEFVRMSHDELARKMGVDPDELRLREELLGLSMVAREAVITGLITTEHALALLPLDSEEDQVKALTRVHREDLSVSETRRMVNALLAERRREQGRPEPPPPAPVPTGTVPAGGADWDLDGVRRLQDLLKALQAGTAALPAFTALAGELAAKARQVPPASFLDLRYREENGQALARHAWNVAKLSAFVGDQMGYAAGEQETLTLAALLYDVGMLEVPAGILERPENLGEDDLGRIRRHPEAGATLLKGLQGLDPAVVQVALEHHERSDGSGYPRKAKEEQTHPFSRFVAVADCFEAVSAPRSHRPPTSPRMAMQAIVLNTYKGTFDRGMVRGFLQALSLYPVGSLMRLGTGELARSVRCVPTDVTRPVVQVIREADGREASPAREIDLSAVPGLTVSDEVGEVPDGV